MIIQTSKKSTLKTIWQAILIAIMAFLLWNGAFMLDYLFSMVWLFLARLLGFNFNDPEQGQKIALLMAPIQLIYAGFIAWLTWWVWRSKAKVLFKAIFLTIPAAVALVMIGIFFYRWPVLSFAVGALATLYVLYRFYKTRQPWQYWWSVIFTALTLAIFFLMGGEI